MPKTIVQEIVFKNTTPKQLYELYMDSKKHADATGDAADISLEEGGLFSAYDNYITGTNLKLIKNKLIVQTWRASDWKKSDLDSIFIIYMEAKGKDTLLNITHANLPDKEADSIGKGWFEYYWEPWKKYLGENGN